MSRIHSRREREVAAERHKARTRRTRLIWLAGIAAVTAVLGLIVTGGLLRDDGEVQTVSAAQREGRVLGETSAPVIITAWEDFQCPVCKAANESTLAAIIQEYVDTGQAQLHFRYFSFLGDESVRAAEGAEAAAAQDKFWEYHDALFTYQGAENSGAYSDDRLRQLAELVGLDMAAFDASMDSAEYKGVVDAELGEGRDRGVNSTPTFFVNGERVEDWRDLDAVRALIDSYLPASS